MNERTYIDKSSLSSVITHTYISGKNSVLSHNKVSEDTERTMSPRPDAVTTKGAL